MSWMTKLGKAVVEHKVRTAFVTIFTAVVGAFQTDVVYYETLGYPTAKAPVAMAELGWRPDIAPAAQKVVEGLPPFKIVDEDGHRVVQANETANVRLWEVEKIALGDWIPNIPQETGDCVSRSHMRAVALISCTQITRGTVEGFHMPSSLAIYGGSRVTIGRGQLRGAGSVNAWAGKYITQYGVIAEDFPGMPAYSGREADIWGNRGVPAQFLDEVKAHPVKTMAKINSSQEAMDALCNLFPVCIASNFGTRTIQPINGRMVARWNDNWPHSMCVDGYDGSLRIGNPRGQRYFHVTNSWGVYAHPKPIDDSPPGGFWITWEDMDRICQDGDTFAYSGFTGFPQQKLENFLSHKLPEKKTHRALLAASKLLAF